MNEEKLTDGHVHLMRLAIRDAKADGFASVSRTLWPHVCELPGKLVDLKPDPEGPGGFVRVTSEGRAVVEFWHHDR